MVLEYEFDDYGCITKCPKGKKIFLMGMTLDALIGATFCVRECPDFVREIDLNHLECNCDEKIDSGEKIG